MYTQHLVQNSCSETYEYVSNMLDATEIKAGTWYVGQGSLSQATETNSGPLKEKIRNLGISQDPQKGWRTRLGNSAGSRKEVSWQSGYAAGVNNPNCLS